MGGEARALSMLVTLVLWTGEAVEEVRTTKSTTRREQERVVMVVVRTLLGHHIMVITSSLDAYHEPSTLWGLAQTRVDGKMFKAR